MKLIPKQASSDIANQDSPKVEHQIRCRAYELYEQRGGTDGHDLQDWLQAESEIRNGKREGVAA